MNPSNSNHQSIQKKHFFNQILLSTFLCVLFLFTGCNNASKVSNNITNKTSDMPPTEIALKEMDNGKLATKWGADAKLPLGVTATSYTDIGLEIPLQEDLKDDLALLGKVWGFLKYYHPVVRSGQLDWDRELIGIFPTYLASDNREARESMLLQWIQALGPIENEKNYKAENLEVALSPDYRWIENEIKSLDLQQKLKEVIDAKRGDTSAYVNLGLAQNADFSNESKYGSIVNNHIGMRMLTLYRMWNAFQYFSPYRDITDVDWDQILEDHMESFILADTPKDFTIANMKLMAAMGDGHVSNTIGITYDVDVFGLYFSPIEVLWAEGKWIVKGPFDAIDKSAWQNFKKVGLCVGDEILSVNGVPCEDLYNKNSNMMSASTEAAKRLEFARYILLRSNEHKLNIVVKRGDEEVNLILETIPLKEFNFEWVCRNISYPSYKELSDGVIYINHGKFRKRDLDKNKEALLNSKTILLDLRGYRLDGGLFHLISMLISGETHGAVCTSASTQTPGMFTWDTTTIFDPTDGGRFKGQIIALADERSISHPEFVSMFIKAMPNSTLIGRPTAGADGNVSSLPLPAGGKMLMTGLGVFYPDKSPTQRIGILPDIHVTQTIKAIKEGRDEIMEAAADLVQCPELLNIQITK